MEVKSDQKYRIDFTNFYARGKQKSIALFYFLMNKKIFYNGV